MTVSNLARSLALSAVEGCVLSTETLGLPRQLHLPETVVKQSDLVSELQEHSNKGNAVVDISALNQEQLFAYLWFNNRGLPPRCADQVACEALVAACFSDRDLADLSAVHVGQRPTLARLVCSGPTVASLSLQQQAAMCSLVSRCDDLLDAGGQHNASVQASISDSKIVEKQQHASRLLADCAF